MDFPYAVVLPRGKMLFPEVPRVIYQKNPLDQVICQVKFPPILRIDAEVPYHFQEAVQEMFPNYTRLSDLPTDENNNPLPNLSNHQLNHQFTSEDEKHRFNLANNALTLTTENYPGWEKFLGSFLFGLKVLNDNYHPTFISRLGLRYIDLISRTQLGLTETAWNDLIQPYILGIEASGAIDAKLIRSTLTTDELSLDKTGDRVRLIHGLVKPLQKYGSETVYVIDCDFFAIRRQEFTNVSDTLMEYNKQARNAFRWCIKPRLHEAMEPETTL